MNPANSQQALASLQQTQAAAQDPNTILANQRQQLGVDAAQQSVTGLRGAINNTTKMLQQVAPGVMGRTGNSLVTSAQANKIIQNEQAPIAQNLENQGREYNQAGEDLGRLEDRAGKAASGVYQGQQDKLSYAQNLYNTLYKQEQDAAATQRAREEFEYGKQQDALSRQDALKAAARSSAGGSTFNLSPPQPQYIGNNDLRGRLAYAAQKGGDQNAAVALKYVGNDGKYYLDPYITNPAIFKALDAVGATNTWRPR